MTTFQATLAKLLPPSMSTTAVEVDEWDESSWARGAGAIVLATPFDRHALAGAQRLQVLARSAATELTKHPRGARRPEVQATGIDRDSKSAPNLAVSLLVKVRTELAAG